MMITPQTDIAVTQALLAQKAEIERLRKLVRRLRDLILRLVDALGFFSDLSNQEIDLLSEAREAIGEGEE